MTPSQFIDNPNWAHCVPEAKDAPRARHLPTHEDCSRLDEEAAASHLLAGGTLGAMKGYEERPGQLEMLKAIVRAFNAREHLVVEAGTGVGKSLAYLVPSILWAYENDTPVIVSTATRNLQTQLIESDIPRARAILGDHAGAFRVALLKGRNNYLCLRAVNEMFASGYWTMSEEEKTLMPAFIDYLTTTRDGDLDRYEGLPRGKLSCPGEECSHRRCPFYSRCFVYKARKNAANAHLVVVNHALVLADATAPGSGLLPAYGRLVLDEAHNLEDIATDYLSRTFSLPDLALILNRLMRRGRNQHARDSGLFAAIERQLQKGILAGKPEAAKIRQLLQDAPHRLTAAAKAAEKLADVAALLLKPAEGRNICRYRVIANPNSPEPRPLRQHALNHLFENYDSESWNEDALLRAQAAFEADLAALVNQLHALRDALDAAVEDGELNFVADLSSQAAGVAESLIAFANETNYVLRGDHETHAYWIEKVRPLKRPSHIRLVAAPLSVADDLRRLFFEAKDSVILSSATLRVGNDFKHMARRLGTATADRVTYLTATSPFDYLRQACVLAADSLPDPSANPSDYATSLATLLRDLFTLTNGRALVLFTSYEMMRSVAEHVRPNLAAGGITLLVQGEGMSRETMTRTLRESASARVVLFGAQSFWEGVDVAGEALSCVVLARLPFAQLGEPIVEARGEKIERDGGSAFRDHLLPEAVIRFRQGFGRLIRTKSDRGVVIVTDPRLVTKSYGTIFRRSIPASVHTVTGADELLRRVAEFFGS